MTDDEAMCKSPIMCVATLVPHPTWSLECYNSEQASLVRLSLVSGPLRTTIILCIHSCVVDSKCLYQLPFSLSVVMDSHCHSSCYCPLYLSLIVAEIISSHHSSRRLDQHGSTRDTEQSRIECPALVLHSPSIVRRSMANVCRVSSVI